MQYLSTNQIRASYMILVAKSTSASNFYYIFFISNSGIAKGE